MRTLPRGNQWGLRGLRSADRAVQKSGMPAAMPGHWLSPGFVTGCLGERAEHIVSAEVEGTLVRVEPVAVVPIYAVEAQGQGCY